MNREEKPLEGRTIVVTRARAQAASFVEALRTAGARVVEAPAIELGPPSSWSSLDAVVDALASYDWLIFTSANGARYFDRRLDERGLRPRDLPRVRVAAVGRATAEAVAEGGLVVEAVPARFVSTEVAPLLGDVKGLRIAVVRAAEGREEMITMLRSAGAIVDLAIAYQTAPAPGVRDALAPLLRTHSVDAVTFTSPSTVDSMLSQLDEEERAIVRNEVLAVAIGPTTAESLRQHGARRLIEAPEASASGLVEALVRMFGRA